MKYLKHIILLILLNLNTSLFAVNANSDMLSKQLDEVQQRLQLSDKQLEKFTPVYKSHVQTQMNIMSKYGFNTMTDSESNALTIKQARAMANELKTERNDALKLFEEILTDEQIQQYQSIQEEKVKSLRAKIRKKVFG